MIGSSDYSSYYRFPFRISYAVQYFQNKIIIEPFIGISNLFGNRKGYGASSTSLTISANKADTCSSSLDLLGARLVKNIWIPELGIKIKYNYKKLSLSLIAEYYGGTQNWNIMKVNYLRKSNTGGNLSTNEFIYSKGKSLVFGLLISIDLFNFPKSKISEYYDI